MNRVLNNKKYPYFKGYNRYKKCHSIDRMKWQMLVLTGLEWSGGATVRARFSELLGGGDAGRVVGILRIPQGGGGLRQAIESMGGGGNGNVARGRVRTLHSWDLSNLLHTSRVERVL